MEMKKITVSAHTCENSPPPVKEETFPVTVTDEELLGFYANEVRKEAAMSTPPCTSLHYAHHILLRMKGNR